MSSSKTPDASKKPSTIGSAKSSNIKSPALTSNTQRNASPPKLSNRSTSSAAKPTPVANSKQNSKIQEASKQQQQQDDEYTKDCPQGLYRLFLTNSTRQAFNIQVSEDEESQHDNIRKIMRQQIVDDISNRGAGSDFHPIKHYLEAYQEEEVTLIYDYEFQYDKNFYICLNKELLEFINNPPLVLPQDESKEPPKYVPPVSKPWITYGSEKEISETLFKANRPLYEFKLKIEREHVSKRQIKFKDVNEPKDSTVTIASMEDKSFELQRKELNAGIQAAPEIIDSSAQTQWKRPKNATTQYEPRTLEKNEIEKLLNTSHLKDFVSTTLPLFSSALQQNEIMNAFADDWKNLGEEMSSIGGPGDIHLKEYQSFSDIHNSKNKIVTCVQWHPTLKGIIAMSLASNYKLYERIDNLAKSVVAPSLILIWSFFDPIQPKLFLEAPSDVFTFAFSPTEPHIIAGGCLNGQVALWDIQPWEDRIVNPRGDHRDRNLFIPGFEDESFFQTPRIRFCALSSLDLSHTQPISDLLWVPDHFEIDRNGYPTENKSNITSQLITTSIDHQVLFWDIRAKNVNVNKVPNRKDLDMPMGIPQTFKHLTQWKPFLKTSLPNSEPGGDYSPTKFTISERQGDRSTLDLEDPEKERADDANKGQFVAPLGKPQSGKTRLLQHLNTRLCIGSEDGQFIYVDWIPQKDADTGKLLSSKPDWVGTVLDGPAVAVKHSPFFKDIILIAGGTTFSIWRHKIFTGPLLRMKYFPKHICDAEWSPTRPAVFFIAKSDGSIDVWDLLDRTHSPILTQSISVHQLTYITCKVISPKQQLIAIGDSLGTLNIMEVPWSLRRTVSGELQAVKAYLTRETERQSYVKMRLDFREHERDEMQKQAAMKAGVGPAHIPTEDEITIRLRNDYNEYLQFEAGVLRELGLRGDDEQPILITA